MAMGVIPELRERNHGNAGRKIKTVSLSTFGKGVLNVDTKGLSAGTYSYTLVVDGKVMETKKMTIN